MFGKADNLTTYTVSAATNSALVTAMNNWYAANHLLKVVDVSFLIYEGAAVYVAFITVTA